MKTFIKPFAYAVAAFALLTSTLASAQTDSKATRLGIGVSLGVPNNDFNFALGGDLRLQQDFSSNVSGLLSVGYTSFFPDDSNVDNFGVIPLKAGLKVFPTNSLYISGEAGAGFGTNEGAGTSFVWSPGVGYAFNNGLDLSLRYEGFTKDGSTLGQTALRIAYGFRLGK